MIGTGLIDVADTHTTAFPSLSITVIAVVLNPMSTETREWERRRRKVMEDSKHTHRHSQQENKVSEAVDGIN